MSITLNGNIGAVYQPDMMQLSNVVDANQIVNNSSTLVDVPQLKLNVDAYERVLFRVNLFYNTATGADFKYQVAVPGSPTLYRQLTEGMAPDDTAFDLAVATSSAAVSILGAANTNGFLRVTGVLVNGANAGTLQFKFAQDAATASDTTVYAGSFLEYRKF
jgi:hypothetical protein